MGGVVRCFSLQNTGRFGVKKSIQNFGGEKRYSIQLIQIQFGGKQRYFISQINIKVVVVFAFI